MDKSFWDGKRASGVLDDIDLTEYNAVVEVFESSVKKYANRPAFTSIGHTLSYGDIDRLSGNFCSYLQHYTDLKPGDRIAIQMANILQFPIAVFGALRAGLVIVNTNPLYTEREMLHQFSDADCRALVFMDVFGDKVQQVLEHTNIKHVIVTSLADMLPNPKRTLINVATKYVKKMVPGFHIPNLIQFRKALSEGEKHPYLLDYLRKPEDVVALQYTGGTTGVAKGAMLSNSNLVANMLQVRAVLGQTDEQGNSLHNKGHEIIIAPLPLYHIYSFTCHLMCLMESGDHSVLIANPRDAGMFIRFMKPWKMTGIVGLNTLFVGLLNHPKFKQLDFSELKLTLSGGTALVEDTATRWKQVTDCAISEAYGLTECSPAVCMNPANGQEQLGTAGLPVSGTALKLIDADENEVAVGERGELCVQGPQVMKGYWNRPAETQDSFTKDGWLKTGDVAVIQDDGFVRIVDRIKDLILVSGFNVYPNEIEDVVASHPGVENCAVIGIADVKTGETPKLFVVASDVNLNETDVRDYCRANLTGYKIPKHVEFRDSLPMTPVGKILRRELKDEEIAS